MMHIQLLSLGLCDRRKYNDRSSAVYDLSSP